MLTPPPRLDLLRSTGKQTLAALVAYVYDHDLDPEAVTLVVTTDGDIKHVQFTPIVASQYYGKTALSYKAIDVEASGLQDFRFIVAVDLPVKVGGLRDAVEEKYGIILDRRDLGTADSVTLATQYGDLDVPVHDESLRFGEGTLRFSLIPKSQLDLSAIIPPTAGQALLKIGDIILPVEP